jgi:glycolate oxidase
MCVQFSAAELTLFHGIKDAWDEQRLLNPGKAVPTLHRCAEFGAMHVHHGELKFPDIPRF